MTKDNQKLLLEHYLAVANNEKKAKGGRDFPPIVRENARKHADDILKGYPELSKEEKKSSKGA